MKKLVLLTLLSLGLSLHASIETAAIVVAVGLQAGIAGTCVEASQEIAPHKTLWHPIRLTVTGAGLFGIGLIGKSFAENREQHTGATCGITLSTIGLLWLVKYAASKVNAHSLKQVQDKAFKNTKRIGGFIGAGTMLTLLGKQAVYDDYGRRMRNTSFLTENPFTASVLTVASIYAGRFGAEKLAALYHTYFPPQPPADKATSVIHF